MNWWKSYTHMHNKENNRKYSCFECYSFILLRHLYLLFQGIQTHASILKFVNNWKEHEWVHLNCFENNSRLIFSWSDSSKRKLSDEVSIAFGTIVNVLMGYWLGTWTAIVKSVFVNQHKHNKLWIEVCDIGEPD